MNSREVEEKKLWQAYRLENVSGSVAVQAGPGEPTTDEIAAYLDRESEDAAAERIEFYLANSAVGLRTMQDLRMILDDSTGEPTSMPAHIMGRAHAAVNSALAAAGNNTPVPLPASVSNGAGPLAALKRFIDKRYTELKAPPAGSPASTFAALIGRGGVWSGLIWSAAIILMAFVSYFGFTIGQETGTEDRSARVHKEISRPDLLFSVDEGDRVPDLMPVGYELGVAE